MTSADHIAFLQMLVVALLAANVLLAVIVILAWRWRPPGTVDPERLSAIERRIVKMIADR
jgi:hypothetical protein